MRWLRRSNVHGGVPVEKSRGLELESRMLHGHDGPVLDPRHMVDPKGVPEHDIRHFEGAVCGHPLGKACNPRMLKWKITCRIPLASGIVLGGHPQSCVHEACALADDRGRVLKGHGGMPRDQSIGHRLADVIQL